MTGPIIPLPFETQRRVWECAVTLRDELAEETTLEEAIVAEVVMRAGPEAVGWEDARDIMRIWGALRVVRV